MDAVGAMPKFERAGLVVTGEGALDASSLRGKVPGGVLRLATGLGRPVAILCGRADVDVEGAEVRSLVERFGAERALGDTRRALEDLAAELAAEAERISSGP